MQQISLTTPQQMFDLGQTLAQSYKIILLQGELGSGKTTLIKGFAAGLGLDHNKVNSPTYTYIQDYDNKLLHIDMYNITTFDELVQKGIAELVHDYDYIAIERPKFIDELGLLGLMIQIEKKDGNIREILINN